MRRQRPAPSTAAASYCSGGTVLSAARKMMIPQPASFQTDCMVMRTRNVSGFVIMSNPEPSPWSRSVWLISPAPPKICWNTVTTSTHEKKWGR